MLTIASTLGCQAETPEPEGSATPLPSPTATRPSSSVRVSIGDVGLFLNDRYRGGARELLLGEDENFVGASSDGTRLVISNWSPESPETRLVDTSTAGDAAVIAGLCGAVTARETTFCVEGAWQAEDGQQVSQSLVEVSVADGGRVATREVVAADDPQADRVSQARLVGEQGGLSLLAIERHAQGDDPRVDLVAVNRDLTEAWSLEIPGSVARAWVTTDATVVVQTGEGRLLVVDAESGEQLLSEGLDERSLLAATDGFFLIQDGTTATAYDGRGALLGREAAPGGALQLFPQGFAYDDPVIYDRATTESGARFAAQVFDATGRLIALGEVADGEVVMRRVDDDGQIDVKVLSGVGADGSFLVRTLTDESGSWGGMELFDIRTGEVLYSIDDDGSTGLHLRDGLIHLSREAADSDSVSRTVVLLPGPASTAAHTSR